MLKIREIISEETLKKLGYPSGLDEQVEVKKDVLSESTIKNLEYPSGLEEEK